jgi:hypothetical protein
VLHLLLDTACVFKLHWFASLIYTAVACPDEHGGGFGAIRPSLHLNAHFHSRYLGHVRFSRVALAEIKPGINFDLTEQIQQIYTANFKNLLPVAFQRRWT